jgi:hypothetical protein
MRMADADVIARPYGRWPSRSPTSFPDLVTAHTGGLCSKSLPLVVRSSTHSLQLAGYLPLH